jgi:hypothetical protein
VEDFFCWALACGVDWSLENALEALKLKVESCMDLMWKAACTTLCAAITSYN